MTELKKVPVLIVGAGPVGLMLSTLLSRYGVESLLVERNATTTNHPQAHVVNNRSMELFQLLGIDNEIRVNSVGPEWSASVRFVNSLLGDQFASIGTGPTKEQMLQFANLSPSRPASCAQDKIEPLILAKANEGIGEVAFETKLVSFEQKENGVEALLSTPNGEQIVAADWLVGCDGAGSKVRSRAGIEMMGPDAIAHIVGIYFHADIGERLASKNQASLLYFIIDEEESGIMIAMDGKERWVFHAAWNGQRQSLDDFDEERCKKILHRAIGEEVEVDIRSVKPWTMSAQIANSYRRGRVLIAGDAAHRFPPTGGFGLNSGVQDSHNLAWKLAAVIQGQAGEGLLDTYQFERQPVAVANCEFSAKNAQGINEVNGPGAIANARKLAAGEVSFEELSAQIQAVAERERSHFGAIGLDLGFTYEAGAIIQDDSQPPERQNTELQYIPNARPGARAPYLRVEVEGNQLSTIELFEGKMTFIVNAPAGDWKAAANTLDYPLQVLAYGEDIREEEPQLPGFYGISEGGAVLVRPDGHVGWRSSEPVKDPASTIKEVINTILSISH